jgi:hypothetical protein
LPGFGLIDLPPGWAHGKVTKAAHLAASRLSARDASGIKKQEAECLPRTHTGPAFSDFLSGSLPAATGRKMRFTGTTVLKIVDGKIVEEVGLDDGVTALTQLGLIRAV